MRRKTFLWIGVTVTSFFFLLWTVFYGLNCRQPIEGMIPFLYANQTDDNLERTYVTAIDSAESSIVLYIYALNDPKIIEALKRKQEQGVKVQVLHDVTTSQRGFTELGKSMEMTALKVRGLMHRKILIIDEKQVWIGSANFTSESLRVHHNLVVGSVSPELAQTIVMRKQHHHFTIGGQMVEFWELPESTTGGFDRLIELIRGAEVSIQVGMFTWTHPQLTQAIIDAADRGVDVEVVLDRGQSMGANKKSVEAMQDSKVHVRLNRGSELFHHKFAIVDGTMLINGSANWTRSAFSRNADCFMVLHELDGDQKKKLGRLWHVIRSTSDELSADAKPLTLFGEWPSSIFHEKFQGVRRAA